MPRATAPTCLICGAPLRKPRHASHVRTVDDQPSTRGDYGDNAFCTERCGYFMALRLLRAIGAADAIRMLPPELHPSAQAREYKLLKKLGETGEVLAWRQLRLLRFHRDHVGGSPHADFIANHEAAP